MDHYIRDFYFSSSDEFSQKHFHQDIPLHVEKGWQWEVIHQKAPTLCKGWFELAQLEAQDQIEFTKEFWYANPFNSRTEPFIGT